MDILPVSHDTATQAELWSLRECLAEVRQSDLPADPPPGHAEVAERLYPAADREPRTWLARDEVGHRTAGPGEVVGVVTMWVFTDENSHMSKVDIQVRADHRRRGLGRRLLGVAADEARAQGRQQVYAWVADGSPGEVFAAGAGARPVLEARRQVLRTAEMTRSTLDAYAGGAVSRTTGYSLVRWVGGCPAELLDSYARLMAVMNDAPVGGSGRRAVEWTGTRIRRDEAHLATLRFRVYVLVARDRASGELAGMTSVHVPADSPRAAQAETTVLGPHRGHGLGLWLKANMMCWLPEAEPGVTEYETHNADDNEHMIAVNHRLGYHEVGTMRMWQTGLA